MLGQCWVNFMSMLGQCWVNVESMTGKRRVNDGSMMRKLRVASVNYLCGRCSITGRLQRKSEGRGNTHSLKWLPLFVVLFYEMWWSFVLGVFKGGKQLSVSFALSSQAPHSNKSDCAIPLNTYHIVPYIHESHASLGFVKVGGVLRWAMHMLWWNNVAHAPDIGLLGVNRLGLMNPPHPPFLHKESIQ